MLSLPPSTRIFLCMTIADMRRGFDGLSAMVSTELDDDPLSGHLFVFRNRRADRLKILYWDRDGYALWYKRLEKGTFKFPLAASGRARRGEVKVSDLMMLLDGCQWTRTVTRLLNPNCYELRSGDQVIGVPP